MLVISDKTILAAIIFSGLVGGDESHTLGEQEVFIGGGGSWATVASMEEGCLGVEVGSARGGSCRQISLFGGWGETWYFVVICLPALGVRCNLAAEEAKRGIWRKL